MMRKLTVILSAAALAAAMPVLAKVGAEEAAALGKDLTPTGSEKAGNKDGSIPAWEPGTQGGPIKGEFPSNAKFDAEKPIYTINKGNVAKYKDKLSAGHLYLLNKFDSYKMNVYPTHRVHANPDWVYKATAENAVKCELIGTDNPDNCNQGFPFPIPKSGAEVIWNHRMKWRGDDVVRYNNQIIVQADGDSQQAKLIEDVTFSYARSKNPIPLTKDAGEFLRYLSNIISPPRNAGTYILVHEKAGTGTAGRQAWLYTPALKRIRRAPAVGYNNPYEGSDGQQFYDQVDMYNGALDRFTWKVLGKRELYITYNSNKVNSPKLKYKDMATPKHFNQELPRYELHRVWVVESNIKPGTSHTFSKRVIYLDEDSWNVVAIDNYDARGELIQLQEGHLVFARTILASTTVPEVIYHFDSGRYFITAAINEDKPYDSSVSYSKDFFTADYVQKNTKK